MSFYRPATTEDFNDFEIEYSNGASMDEWTKKLIEQGDISKAANYIRNRNGTGINECMKYCFLYQNYVFARRDFEQGKPVFVAY